VDFRQSASERELKEADAVITFGRNPKRLLTLYAGRLLRPVIAVRTPRQQKQMENPADT
jgi:hypothetical protein